MRKKYSQVLFDLDNTLVDDDANRRFAIEQILIERKDPDYKKKADSFVAFDTKFWSDRAAGIIQDPYEFETIEEKTRWIRAERFIRFFGDVSFDEGVEINRKYITYLNEHIVPIKNAEEILRYLYEKSYEIYIVTNGPIKAIDYKLGKLNAIQYVKRIFSAEEAGFMKPSDEYFEKFFQAIGPHDRGEMIIIGDELDKDVLGGIRNGIDSCWVNFKKSKNNSELIPSYEINELIELKSFL